jgi:hypothetical protein
MLKTTEDAHMESMSTFEANEHLQASRPCTTPFFEGGGSLAGRRRVERHELLTRSRAQ